MKTRTVLGLIARPRNGAGRTGLAVSSDGAGLARVVHTQGRPRLTHCEWQPIDDTHPVQRSVGRAPYTRSPAVAVMAPGDYRLMLVDAPEVPKEELRSALRWRIKDLIDFHIDDAVVDVFEMPAPARGGHTRPLYAVAVRAELVRKQVETLEDAGLALDALDIPELCLRNVAARIEREREGVALLYLAADHGILVLARSGVLYLTRRIDTGTSTLRGVGDLASELVATLALEVRRSLDYFESHYAQTPLPRVHTVGVSASDRAQLAEDLSLPVEPLSLGDVLDVDCEVSEQTLQRCLPAVGAALRPAA
jgi:MSHA biogenesis protein MshI